jgi:hypothetical protein
MAFCPGEILSGQHPRVLLDKLYSHEALQIAIVGMKYITDLKISEEALLRVVRDKHSAAEVRQQTKATSPCLVQECKSGVDF